MKMVKPIFKNGKLQTLFEKNGFVKLPLLNWGQVDQLVTLFHATQKQHATVSSLQHTTTETGNTELMYRVDTEIKAVFLPELEKVMTDFKPLAACLHIKEVGSGSATGMHQDPTFVDESEYCSANVWVALQDTDQKNGNLFFINGSNRAVSSLRITPGFPNYYESFSDSLPQMAVHVPLNKGESVIFNNATIHGATDNLSEQQRLAATLLVCSKNAEWLIHYRENANDKIEQYHLNLDTFLSISKNGRPNSKAFKQYITSDFPQITKSDFLQRVGMDAGQKRNYLQRIKDAFRTSAST